MDIKITLTCPKCARAIVLDNPEGVPPPISGALCDTCRFKGFGGWLMTPVLLIMDLTVVILNAVAFVLERFSRRR